MLHGGIPRKTSPGAQLQLVRMASYQESGDDVSETAVVGVSWRDRLLLPTTIAIWGHPPPLTSQREPMASYLESWDDASWGRKCGRWFPGKSYMAVMLCMETPRPKIARGSIAVAAVTKNPMMSVVGRQHCRLSICFHFW